MGFVVAALVIGAMLLLAARRMPREPSGLQTADAHSLSDAVPGVSPEIQFEIDALEAANFPVTAAVAHTPAELRTLLREKLPEWPWAVFVSVLVQRRDAVADRLRDVNLGFSNFTGEKLHFDWDVAQFAIDRMSELSSATRQLEDVMTSRTFTETLRSCADENTVNAEDLMHTANRLMDTHDRFLEIAQRCRAVRVPVRHDELLRDCATLATLPLDGYRRFLDDLEAMIDRLPALLHYGHGAPLHGGQVVLDIAEDDEVTDRVFAEIRRLTNH